MGHRYMVYGRSSNDAAGHSRTTMSSSSTRLRDRQTDEQTDIPTNEQTDRPTDRQTNKPTDEQMDRRTSPSRKPLILQRMLNSQRAS